MSITTISVETTHNEPRDLDFRASATARDHLVRVGVAYCQRYRQREPATFDHVADLEIGGTTIMSVNQTVISSSNPFLWAPGGEPGDFSECYGQLGGSPELTESSRTNRRFPMRTYLSRPSRKLRHTVDGSTP